MTDTSHDSEQKERADEQRFKKNVQGLLVAALVLTFFALPALPSAAQAQEYVPLGDDSARVVTRVEDAVVLKCQGERVASAPPQAQLRHEWYVVQDSSMGIVFTECSGLKASPKSRYDGDVDIRALTAVQALEVRSATFDAWRDFTGTKEMFRWVLLIEGDTDDFDPRWSDVWDTADEHLISVTYVSRVMMLDTETLERSIREADITPVLEIASKIDRSVTADSLQMVPDSVVQVSGQR